MRRTLYALLVVATAGVGVVACQASPPGDAPPGHAERPSSDIRWGPCPADATGPGLECSTLQVPLDYRKPDGQTVEIAISRLQSADPTQRRGALLVNPGGPDTGLQYPTELTTLPKGLQLPPSVRAQYDIIGFDPRGQGHSMPVSCNLSTEQQRLGNIPPYARDAADVTRYAAQSKQIAEQCAQSPTGRLRPYVTTANVARDMDRIRAALGEHKISYFGSSWGTYLGSLYATLFPQRGDRILLDSNEGLGGPDYAGNRLFAQGFQDQFATFAKNAAAHDAEYHLGDTPEKVAAKYSEIAAKLDRTPVQAPDARYDGAMFRTVTFSQFFSDGLMNKQLGSIWHNLDTGKAPPLLPGAKPGPAPDADKKISGRFFMNCGDSRWPTSVEAYQHNVAADRSRYPLFGAAGADIQPCAYWPDPVEAPVQIGGEGPSNILMLQNLRDPATPLAGARQTRQAFGDRARMVTVDQGGHGVYPFGANACGKDAATAFLTTGRRPASDLGCPAESR